VSDPQVSPDGTRVAYVVRRNDRDSDERHSSIFVAPLDGKSPARAFTQGKRDGSPRWSPDGRSLAFISDRGEKGQVFLAPLDGGERRRLTKAPHGVNVIAWSPDSTRIAYVARAGDWKDMKERDAVGKAAPRVIRDLRYRLDTIGYFDERRTHVFVADVASGETRQITDGDWFDTQITWSPDGNQIAFSSDRQRSRHQRQFRADLWVVGASGGRAHRLTRCRGAANFPQFSPDGRSIAFIGHENGESASSMHSHLMVVPALGGEAPRSISAALDRSTATAPGTSSFAWLPDSKAIVFLAVDRGTQALFRAGLRGGEITRVLDGDRVIRQIALTPHATHLAFVASSLSRPAEVYATALDTGARERNLSHANDDLLAAADLGQTRRLAYRAPDGLEIDALVLYPPGYNPGARHPLTLYIHGGPHNQHPGVGFSMRPQALAGAGHVVLMPNPRGSSGYGEAFQQACVRDWGGGDYEDLMAGVDAMVKRGIADPDRLYVTGYSYGGFMTTWVVGHTQRFRAAIVGAPVANHVSMIGTSDIPLFSNFELGGSLHTDIEEWWEHSPLKHLPNVTTPVLLEHHEGDLRCPITQAEEIFQHLKLLGKEVEFLRYPGGFHILDFHAPSQDLDYMQRANAWFASHAAARRGQNARKSSRATRGGAAETNGRAGTDGRAANNGRVHAAKNGAANKRITKTTARAPRPKLKTS
jgi:dipeptidyl aminopeptidase/acylaminoacyl peptidase